LNRLTGYRGRLHSAHWSASSLKLPARCPVSGCWPSCCRDCACCACIGNQTINLLLIGETGVGKSTWINAFANYIRFSTLSEAKETGGRFPVSSVFDTTHPQTGHRLRISNNRSIPIIPIAEVADVDLPVAEIPTKYVFEYNNTRVCIIDTPGLPGAQGGGNNNERLNRIITLISSLNEIHAICVVMKANQTELSSTFENMLTEVLTRLNISASNNVIFLLTHAASTNFQPDATQEIPDFLRNRNLQITLRQDSDALGNATIYCFENDSVQYLAEHENDIPVPDGFNESLADTNWSRSQTSAHDMVRYVCSLSPLQLADVMAIYDAQYITGILSQLVLEILKHDAENERKFQSKLSEAKNMINDVASNPALIRSFDPSVTTVRIVHKKLDRENVVCGAQRCVEFVNDEAVYTKICCRACKSLFVYFCGKINFLGDCKICNCSMNEHRYTKKESKIVRDAECVADVGNQAAPTVNIENAQAQLAYIIATCAERLNQYREERKRMLKTCAKLNTHVRNVLGESHVDELKKHLEHRIATYRADGQRPGTHRGLRTFENFLNEYNDFLQEVSQTSMTSADVRPLIERLYNTENLPLNGENLREAMEAEESARLRTQKD